MKRAMALFGLALSTDALAASATIALNNFDGNNGNGCPVYYPNAFTLAPVGQNIFVEVLGGLVGSSLTPVTDRAGNPVLIPMGASGAGPGWWDAGAGLVPGVAPNGLADFQVRAWRGQTFATSQERGESPRWTQTTGSWTAPAAIVVGPPLNIPASSILISGQSTTNNPNEPLSQWTARNSGTTNSLLDITYAKGTFVAVGNSGTVLTSPDGVAWTRRNSGTAQVIAAIAYGNGTFAAVGPSLILTSTDGLNWRSGAPPTALLSTIVFGNDSFVALGNTTLLSSQDGVVWTTANPGLTDLAGLAFGRHTFLVTGRTNWYSPRYGTQFLSVASASGDGITWTNALSYDAAQMGYLTGVAYGNDRFLLMRSIPWLSNWTAILSWDGTNCVTLEGGTGYEALLGGTAFGGNTFVTVGDQGIIRTSTSGTNWITRPSGTLHALSGITFGQETFVAVGEGGAILQSAPLTLPAMSPSLDGRFTSAGFELTVSGTSGQSVSLQSADSLSANTAWQTLVTFTLTNNSATWLDRTPTNRPQRFYRTTTAP